MKQFTRGISLCLMVILLVGLQGWSSAAVPRIQITPEPVYPHPYRATWLETVQITPLPWTLTLVDMSTVKIFVANREAITTIDPLSNTASFVLPERIWGGPQQFSIVGVHTETNQTLILAEGIINVLGQSVFDDRDNTNTPTSIFFLSNFSSLDAFHKELINLGIDVITDRPGGNGIDLGGDPSTKNPCGYKLYEARPSALKGQPQTAPLPIGEALEVLEKLEPWAGIYDADGVFAVDPRPGDSLNPVEDKDLISEKGINKEKPMPIAVLSAVNGGQKTILGTTDTTIAILDTGVAQFGRPNIYGSLNKSFVNSDPFLDYYYSEPNPYSVGSRLLGHGTPVAFLASSISPSSKILSVQVCDSKGKCPFSSVIRGICHVVNFAKSHLQTQVILNISLGADTPSQIIYSILRNAMTTPKYPGGNIKIDQPLIRVVASSGNDWKVENRTKNRGDLFHYPAAFAGKKGLSTKRGSKQRISSLEDLISVGAVGKTEKLGFGVAEFSNQGDYISIVAPGLNVYSRNPSSYNPNGDFQLYTGTSFAAPIVAGALALISPSSGTYENSASGAAIKEKLLKLVKPIYDENIRANIGQDNLREAVGKGMLDLSSLPRR